MESYRSHNGNQGRKSIEEERPADKRYNGLKNQGATCYLNSVLQCLYMTEDFRKEVENFVPAQRNSDKESLMQEMQKLFKEMKEGDCTTKGITRTLGITNVFEQEDVVEYYQKTLKAVGPQHSMVFEGKMSNKTKCINNHIFEEESHFFTIPLAIEAGHNEVFNVIDGLNSFFKRLKIDEDNWLYCKQCGQKIETETWKEITEFPTILTLYPKRFYFDRYQMRPVKNHCHMDIPMQFQISSNLRYELHAVINHIGNEYGGHYNAVIKSFDNGKWYCFDDTSVREDSENSFKLSKQAYLLMYRKVDRISQVEKSTNEYYELAAMLLQMIQHFISVFKESKFPTNYKETEILCHQVVEFKKTHLPEIEADKKHCYKIFEVAVQAVQIKVHPSYHPISIEKLWCQLQKAIIKQESLLRKEFKQVYYLHHHLVNHCGEYSVPLTQPDLDKAMLYYIQDLLDWVEKKQRQIQNMEWGADLQSTITDFKSNIDHAQADETQLTPANRQQYRLYLDKLDSQYKTLLENLKQHHHNIMSQDSEPGFFVADECKQVDCNKLPQSKEQAEQYESVCKSYIIRNKNLRLKLEKYGSHILRCLKQSTFAQESTEQKELQTMLENTKQEFDAMIKSIEAQTFTQQSTWAYNLCWEIDLTMKELEHVYSLFSEYCKAKSGYLKTQSTQNTGDVHKKYEKQLYDFHKVPANDEKEMASNQELLKKVCCEVEPDVSVEHEFCDPMMVHLPQMEVDLIGRQMQDYRQRYEQLVQWIADVKQKQENIWAKPLINNKEFKEKLAQGKKLCDEIIHTEDKMKEFVKWATEWVNTIKDHKHHLETCKTSLNPFSSIKVESASGITQEISTLQARYSDLLMLVIKFNRDMQQYFEENC